LGVGFIQDRRLRADVLFIRTQSAIRADGYRPRKLSHNSLRHPPMFADVGRRPLRAARANRVFRTDEKRIRAENTVIDKSR